MEQLCQRRSWALEVKRVISHYGFSRLARRNHNGSKLFWFGPYLCRQPCSHEYLTSIYWPFTQISDQRFNIHPRHTWLGRIDFYERRRNIGRCGFVTAHISGTSLYCDPYQVRTRNFTKCHHSLLLGAKFDTNLLDSGQPSPHLRSICYFYSWYGALSMRQGLRRQTHHRQRNPYLFRVDRGYSRHYWISILLANA